MYNAVVISSNVLTFVFRQWRGCGLPYGIFHTAHGRTVFSRTYAIVAYIRHNNNAGSSVVGIPAIPH